MAVEEPGEDTDAEDAAFRQVVCVGRHDHLFGEAVAVEADADQVHAEEGPHDDDAQNDAAEGDAELADVASHPGVDDQDQEMVPTIGGFAQWLRFQPEVRKMVGEDGKELFPSRGNTKAQAAIHGTANLTAITLQITRAR